MTLGGLALAAWNTWQRLGRSAAARSWARDTHRDFAQRNVLVTWPLMAATLLLGGVLGAVDAGGGATLLPGLLLLLSLALWLAFAVLPLPVPRFVQPRWYREQLARPDGKVDPT